VARPASENPKVDQVNVRLTGTLADALEAIEYIDEISGPELLRSLLAAEITRRERDPLFVAALRVRREARLRRDGRLAHLPTANEGS
jgi:hypothetical protein